MQEIFLLFGNCKEVNRNKLNMKALTLKSPMPWPVLILLLLLWGGGPIRGLILGISLRIPFISAFSNAMPNIITIIFVLLSVPYFLKKIRNVDLFFYVFIAIIFLLNYLLYPNNNDILDIYAYPFLVASVPFYFIGLVYDIEKLFNYTAIVSIIALLVSATSVFLFGHVEELTTEAMTAGHKCLPHVLLMIMCVFIQKRNRWIYLGFAAIGILLLLVYANRMSLFAVLCFLACCLFLMPASSKNKTRAKRVAALIIVIVAFSFVGSFVTGIESISAYFGTSTRIVDYYNQGDVLDSNGRDYLWSQMIYHIVHNPFGVGLGGDRLLINTWSHNLFLEILLSFGLFLGPIIILMLLYVIYIGFRYAKDNIQRFFLLILFFAGVFKLQFSSSFLNDSFIFFMVGYCIFLYRNRNNGVLPKIQIENIDDKSNS